MADGSPFGMLSGRIATWIQVVCTSRAPLPPFETPCPETARNGPVTGASSEHGARPESRAKFSDSRIQLRVVEDVVATQAFRPRHREAVIRSVEPQHQKPD